MQQRSQESSDLLEHVRGSKEQWKNFKESVIWQDIVQYLMRRRMQLLEDLELSESGLEEIRFLQGSIDEVKNLINLTDVVISDLTYKEKLAEKQNEEDEDE